MHGSIAEAYYSGVPAWMKQKANQFFLPVFKDELQQYGELELKEYYKFL